MPGIYRGDINIGTTIRFTFNTRDSSGNPISLSGSPVVSIYKGGIATPCATAPVLTVNYNGQTGRHLVTVDTSLDTTFYAAGNDFFAVITTGTVNGVSVVGVEVAQWSINNRSVVTAVQVRQEMDSNSTKLANMDVAVSSRLATSAYTTPPTVSAIQSGLATHADVTTISAAITALGSPLQAAAYAAPTTPPTVVQIRQELDSNSTKLANMDVAISSRLATSAYSTPPTVSAIQSGLATHADATTISAAITALGSPLQTGNYVLPPSAAVIAATTAAVLFVDGATHPIKVNSDHSVNSTTTSTSPISIVIPAVVAVASQDPSVMTCLRGDTLRFTLPLMGDLRNRTKLVFTAKASVSDSDSMAVLQIFEGTGLVRLNGNGQVNSSTASLIVTNESTGVVNLEIDASVTAVLAVQDLVWDVQAILSTGVTTPVCGTLSVVADVTQSVT